MVQKGSVSAAIALERALRLEDPDEEEEDDLFASSTGSAAGMTERGIEA